LQRIASDRQAVDAVSATEVAAFVDASAKATQTAAEVNACVMEVVAEVVSEFANGELIAAITSARRAEAKVGGILAELQRLADHGDGQSGRTKEQMVEILRQARAVASQTPLNLDPIYPQRLIAELHRDPSFAITAPPGACAVSP
jgi:hypothetical protein